MGISENNKLASGQQEEGVCWPKNSICKGPEGRNRKALSGQEQKGTNEGSLDEVGSQPCGRPVIVRASQDMGPQELRGCRGQKGRFKHREQNSVATREPTGELVKESPTLVQHFIFYHPFHEHTLPQPYPTLHPAQGLARALSSGSFRIFS